MVIAVVLLSGTRLGQTSDLRVFPASLGKLLKDYDSIIVGAFSLGGGLKIELVCPCFSSCPGKHRWLDRESRDFKSCGDVSTFRSVGPGKGTGDCLSLGN